MNNPNVNLGCVKNLFVRQMHFINAGDCEEGHVHQFDHLTLLAKGRLAVGINGEVTEFTAPQMIYINANLRHKIVALSDNTVAYCIHALREESGDILDTSMVPKSKELYDLLEKLVVINEDNR
jgi:quercetin dioxygenase-like cupin family protein